MRYANACCSIRYNPLEKTITITGLCIVTGATVSVTVPKAGLDAYNTGVWIQDAFPDLSADEREFLISGIGPGQFDNFLDGPEASP